MSGPNDTPVMTNGVDPNANSSAVPAQMQPTPNSMPASAQPAAPQLAASGQPAMPGGAPATGPTITPGQNMDAGVKQSMAGKIMQDIAGGQTTDYVQTDKGPVAVKRNLKPGELARNILGAAFSLVAAGAGGDLAAKEHRQYVQPEEQTIGAQRRGAIQQRQTEAENEFKNKQVADEGTLRAHQDAREQQTYMAQLGKDQDAHNEAVQRLAAGDRSAETTAYDTLVRQTTDYNKAMAMPGASIMQGPDGKNLSFINADEAQKYAVAHPEVIHGSTNGATSRYGVVPVTNPWTGMVQFVDYPADRHETGLTNVGQKHDKQGNPMYDANGEPIPDGTILDPKSHKPTVLTQTVTPDQARAIKSSQITRENTIAEIGDREAQTQLREAQAKKDGDLQDAIDIYGDGQGLEKLTPKQKQIMARYIFQEQTLTSNRENQAATKLQKAEQVANDVTTDPEVKKAQAEYDDAKNAYDDITEKYNGLTGNTPGVILGNRILRAGMTNLNWGAADKQIQDSALPVEEQNKAKAKVWNAMSPAQQAAARGGTPQQAPQPGAGPLVKPPTPGAKIAGNQDALSRYVSAAGGDKAKAAQMAKADGWDLSK
jgi:hypothetical protein